ncbi:ribokinase [Desulfovibrio sp. OttesenSCG-928-I05]|nr:ribokinase [Desulfovibrio sp. OttesenSCG-928-I05]
MKIVNYGSLNIDFVYAVDHIVLPGETIQSAGLEVYCGGKGLNQSVALARAGAAVSHAGMTGADGGMLLELLRENGVDISHVRTVPTRTGNAVIQVDATGQNSIVLFGGANMENSEAFVDATLACFEPGDLLLLQNEINLNGYIIERAAEKGLKIVLNPSPFNDALGGCDLSRVSLFIMNEVEGEQITGKSEPSAILQSMRTMYPGASVVLTLGERGAAYCGDEGEFFHAAYAVEAVDTTGAGDTFTGYFLAAVMEGQGVEQALRLASLASSLAVSRSGAAPSIPLRREVDEALRAL